MNIPILICNQIPCKDIPYLKRTRLRFIRMMAYVYWGFALLFSVCGIWYQPLLVLAGLFIFIGALLFFQIKYLLHLCNTVEFFENAILLRNHCGEVIRTIKYASVLRADTVTLRFSYRPRIYGRFLCLWLAETPPLYQEDSFAELVKWEELFLFAYHEGAAAILREKVRFQ